MLHVFGTGCQVSAMLVSWEISLDALVVVLKAMLRSEVGAGYKVPIWDKFLSSRAGSALARPAEATTIVVDCPLGAGSDCEDVTDQF